MEIDGATLGRILLVAGVLAAACGLVLVLGGRLPIGRLPGDLSGSRGSVSWSVPIGTSILLSVVLTVVLNVILRR